MFTESRKIQLLEDVIKETNEATLLEIEGVLKKHRKKTKVEKKPLRIQDFAGVFTREEGDMIKKVIAETCEIIDPNDWK